MSLDRPDAEGGRSDADEDWGARAELGDPEPASEPTHPRFGLMVGGRAPSMRAALALLERAAATEVTVLLTGETGTGKEVAAESIHMESRRRGGPFIVVDCGAIPAELLESELFGHERGSFTGAVGRRIGAFEAASGGTIFLDEVGELPLALQPKLLRALETGQVKRVGSGLQIASDVRIIAATNRDLREELEMRRFRPDLYYRLAVLEVRLPRLAERREDLAELVAHMLQRRWGQHPDLAFLTSEAVIRELAQYDWPGNVRELRNHIDRSVAMRGWTAPSEPSDASSNQSPPTSAPALVDVSRPYREQRDRVMRDFDVAYLTGLLRATRGNVSAAARIAGVDRVHLYRLLWRNGLGREAEPPKR